MPRIGLWLTILFFLSACSSHNPFENSRSDFRIDGSFVNFKAAGLPGGYASDDGADVSYLNISEDGRIEFLYPNGSEDCQLRVRGELASVRQIQKPVQTAEDTMEFRFGTFKSQVNPEITHVLIALIDLYEDEDPQTVAIEGLYQGDLVVKMRRKFSWETDEANTQDFIPVEEQSEMGSEQECLNLDLANFYDHDRRLFFIPVQWTDNDLIFGDIVWRKE